MTEREYDAIQYDLSKLLKKVRGGRGRAHGRREEAYEEGVLACKSAISRYNPNPKHREVCTWAKQLETNPWIPVTERLPETNDYILISFENYTLPDIGRYEIDAEGNGTFYPGDGAMSYASIGIFVNAWMPLPKSYRESEGQEEKRSSKMPEAAVGFIRRRFMTRQ